MTSIAAITFTVLIALLAIFQLALVFGAPLGRFAWGGQNDVLPPRLRRGSIIAVVLYAAFSLILLAASGVLVIPVLGPVGGLLCWMITVYLSFGVVMNALSRSRPERFVMTPVAMVLFACALIVALG
ncbi:hypothetical protein GCM10027022_02230 [Alpinimonas psychrophila]|uniref:Thiol:disulfide interchange protein n=1 Tax=Alpinimonas psychrophila TaxID=748908 RepID=A0A7W3PN30_9MICO|nr:hypothetical protein [Alpinimonas psychrophila]MBA8828032.1 thiol:disulfide interchange protein [Alpinimonas psychrophila]